ncbi:4Fe-4S cluster-binding domain-containing protein, partial [Salmonella enterica subsp. enterica serovar Kentucky]|nr:4Fe-4S cluster-binding domain-containing protein [Salmonella enterica subsp. enterica serovar Kentucky]
MRFITFFQGCLMRCLYCHNRDTWDTHGGKEITVEDLMKEVVTTSIPSQGDDMPAYYARPKASDGALPVVIVVQEIFGVHEHIRD